MRRLFALAACIGLAACAAPETTRRADMGVSLPPMKTFERKPSAMPRLSNDALAQDFLELTFVLENGMEMSRFTRFEGPVTVRVEGTAPPSLSAPRPWPVSASTWNFLAKRPTLQPIPKRESTPWRP